MPNNQRIRKFNEQAKAYNACMHGWLDNANAAVKQIQTKANSDIKQITETANAAMKDIEGKISAATLEASQLEQDQEKAIVAAKSGR